MVKKLTLEGYYLYNGRKINQIGHVYHYSDGKLLGLISDISSVSNEIASHELFLGTYFKSESSIAFVRIPAAQELKTKQTIFYSLISDRLDDKGEINGDYSGFFKPVGIINFSPLIASAIFEGIHLKKLVSLKNESLIKSFFRRENLDAIDSGSRRNLRAKLSFSNSS